MYQVRSSTHDEVTTTRPIVVKDPLLEQYTVRHTDILRCFVVVVRLVRTSVGLTVLSKTSFLVLLNV